MIKYQIKIMINYIIDSLEGRTIGEKELGGGHVFPIRVLEGHSNSLNF